MKVLKGINQGIMNKDYEYQSMLMDTIKFCPCCGNYKATRIMSGDGKEVTVVCNAKKCDKTTYVQLSGVK